jgi:hypothetical protein
MVAVGSSAVAGAVVGATPRASAAGRRGLINVSAMLSFTGVV